LNLKIIEVFCALMLGLQVIFFQLVQLRIIEPWHFPAVVFLCISVLLGGVGVIFGIASWAMRKQDQGPVRTETALLFLMCVSSLGFVQFGYGWKNFNLTAGNDYSTDIANPPQFKLSKTQRLHVKEVSAFWAFMDIPHRILESDVQSIVLPKSSLELKRIINQVTNKLGWVLVRRLDHSRADQKFNETYEFLGSNPIVKQRTDVVIRVISNTADSSVVDIRSSSPGRRRDLGFNELMIRMLADELEASVVNDQVAGGTIRLRSQMQLVK
tara:strand:+ start:206 stop:1012 length:807 start_codon:yes stop_codon:yes gene_type:complete